MRPKLFFNLFWKVFRDRIPGKFQGGYTVYPDPVETGIGVRLFYTLFLIFVYFFVHVFYFICIHIFYFYTPFSTKRLCRILKVSKHFWITSII